MDTKVDKVYVAVGNDLQEGYKTLEWTLRKWNSRLISITILHVDHNISQDLVCTPFGKLPASFVSEEAFEVYRKYEREKADKLLFKYKAFCGKVKVEVLKVQIFNTSVHKLIVDLISKYRITKLVMGITFLKSSSSKKLKSALSGSLYVHQHKPEFCEMYILYGGRLVYLEDENNEGILEDDQGVSIAKLKEKGSFKGFFGRVLNESDSPRRNSHRLSISSTNSNSGVLNNYQANIQEIENYYQQLLSSNLDEEELQENETLQTSPKEQEVFEIIDSGDNTKLGRMQKIKLMKSKIKEAQEMIEFKKKEVLANVERRKKAEWAISICNQRAEELESSIKEVASSRKSTEKNLNALKGQLHEIINDVEESKRRLSSLMELQFELSNKLLISTQTKLHTEVQLEKAVGERAEIVREIEELRRQRNVFRRRIDFCRDKDAIEKVTRLKCLTWSYREYTADDIRLATDNFAERLRLKIGGNATNVYRGRINHETVAIKMLSSLNGPPQEALQSKVRLLGEIRHPHLVAMIGFCPELNCMVFEYMRNGSLDDILFHSHPNSRKKMRTLHWLDRTRIASEICSSLVFLHSAQPKPIVHGHLTLSNILLDRNLVAKVHNFGLNGSIDKCDVRLDIRAFGVLLIHLLTGKHWAGLLEESMNVNMKALVTCLDGPWPWALAQEIAGLAVKCMSVNSRPNMDLGIAAIMEELNVIKRKASEIVTTEGCEPATAYKRPSVDGEHADTAPSYFLCPIFQEIMKNPHVAADGFSYELEAIEEWLATGSETSPMTNLKLKHKYFTPNHTLRSLIQEWKNRKSTIPP